AIMTPKAAAREVTIAVHRPAAPARLHGPSGKLAQIALLLVEEAILHAANGARITLGAEGEETEFTLDARISAAGDAPARMESKRLDRAVALEGGHVRRGQAKAGKPLALACHFGAEAEAAGQPSPSRIDATTEGN
ncbi:MAG TPA: hypothetical protein VK090_05405, partial [Paracoccaceae bacterium]|nr:hypothetical protein [Paracoccaceae bacterium]